MFQKLSMFLQSLAFINTNRISTTSTPYRTYLLNELTKRCFEITDLLLVEALSCLERKAGKLTYSVTQ